VSFIGAISGLIGAEWFARKEEGYGRKKYRRR
jgi:hypothetical protein